MFYLKVLWMRVNMIKPVIVPAMVILLFSVSFISIPGMNYAESRQKADTLNWPASFGLGRAATVKEIALLDTDVRPDGKGLPEGAGVSARGKLVYAEKCSGCHGATGVEGPNDQLVVNKTLTDPKAIARHKTIGNYWPYATTVFDYIKRAMPFNQPGSLTDQEVYDLTAFLLHENGLIKPEQVINAKTLPEVVMPAHDLFVPDDRKDGPEVR